MPVQLHVDTAGPLNHRIAADRIGKRRNHHAGAGGLRRADRGVHVGDQIAVALRAERIGHGRRETEQRNRAGRRLQQLDVVLLGVGVTVATTCLVLCPPKVASKLAAKPVYVLRRNVDMCGAVLWRDRNSRQRGGRAGRCPAWNGGSRAQQQTGADRRRSDNGLNTHRRFPVR
ncbi:MAG: hypothetical protein WDN04_05525 [Rhodospirillales bacterium]